MKAVAVFSPCTLRPVVYPISMPSLGSSHGLAAGYRPGWPTTERPRLPDPRDSGCPENHQATDVAALAPREYVKAAES
jgi:hypothetical protein